jgi:hypothetical protein
MKAKEIIQEWTDTPQEKAKVTADFRKRYSLSQEEADACYRVCYVPGRQGLASYGIDGEINCMRRVVSTMRTMPN